MGADSKYIKETTKTNGNNCIKILLIIILVDYSNIFLKSKIKTFTKIESEIFANGST